MATLVELVVVVVVIVLVVVIGPGGLVRCRRDDVPLTTPNGLPFSSILDSRERGFRRWNGMPSSKEEPLRTTGAAAAVDVDVLVVIS